MLLIMSWGNLLAQFHCSKPTRAAVKRHVKAQAKRILPHPQDGQRRGAVDVLVLSLCGDE